MSHSDISLTGSSSVRGPRLVLTQIVALLMKRFQHSRRDWRGSLSKVLLPVLFVALAMALFSVKPLAIDYPSLKLTPRLYDNAESFFRYVKGSYIIINIQDTGNFTFEFSYFKDYLHSKKKNRLLFTIAVYFSDV